MRSAIACVFFALIIHKEGSRAASDDFRPTPIPLNEWRDDDREGRAGTLHETIRTEAPPTVAVIPAHYWEDALRHSVYLTLVRDKIDQLIAKVDVISQSTKHNQQVSKEVDDHDLWEKIKTAPFDRLPEEDPSSFGDVAIMARGRLLQEKDGFRFTEDNRTKEKCSDDKCMEGVKAIWSVKRVRQRDQETSPGRYHYELTFSVISQTPKKQKKPYENPIRTFTVRESTPDRITEPPQEYKKREYVAPQVMRPERAVWIHRNIVPTKYHLGRSYYHGLDRIFSSLFSDDDDEIPPPDATPRHKSNSYVPQVHLPMSKTGYVGAPTDQYQQNVKYTPYPYKQPVKYSRPIPPPPIGPTSQHYVDVNSGEIPSGNQYNNVNQYPNGNNHYSNGNYYTNNNQYGNNNQYLNDNKYTNGNNHFHNGNPHTLQSDYKHMTSNKPIRTTRPAVLPTPLPPVPPTKDMSFEVNHMMRFNNGTTHVPETITVYKNYNKFRSPSSKINYFSEHVRPPIYNAPPGVFVTMDKKPFKPMPPLKGVPTQKPLRNNRPIDFRPSPQILDNQSTEKDYFKETAFRPITAAGYPDNSTIYDELYNAPKKGDGKLRKPNIPRKPTKKNENTKLHKLTTIAPEIITAANVHEEDIEEMEWANILSAFTKTTPMESTTEKLNTETTTQETTTQTTSNDKKRTNTTTETLPETSTSTTPKPKKRTRPPPKFVKQDKLKKHKRVTTNSTTSTNKGVEKSTIKRPTKDLIPQASSAAISSTKSLLETTSKKSATITSTTSTTTTTTTTSTTPTPSTTIASTSTSTTKPATTITPRPTTSKTSTTTTTRKTTIAGGQNNRNRFRQSTLMLKGTSVKHDKWSSKNQTSTVSSGTYRRKGSNFQGYLSSPMPNISDKETRKRHPDRANDVSIIDPTEVSIKPELSTQSTTTKKISEENDSVNETTVDNYQEEEYDENEEEKNVENVEEESKDHTEFIFQTTTLQPSDTTNELSRLEENVTNDELVETTPHSSPKNKTKCKKKKSNIESKTENNVNSLMSTTSTTTEKYSTTNILQDLFDFDFSSVSEKENEISSPKPELDEEESENHDSYLKVDDDFNDFLDKLGEKQSNSEGNLEDEHYDDDEDKLSPIDDEDSETVSEKEKNSGRHSSDDNYEDYQDRPYSFLELLAME